MQWLPNSAVNKKLLPQDEIQHCICLHCLQDLDKRNDAVRNQRCNEHYRLLSTDCTPGHTRNGSPQPYGSCQPNGKSS
ncbi:hypothetical protein HNY73_005227 [Argiope bruennichi]|uniref:Uncharacterized protein n=1 Tax=Argiope bruennichi TaxID=94029 RepID=A0A8T0FI92_ARGBR|nr:hypothetical protein HNY73_005227 [Argiope bruennichi]